MAKPGDKIRDVYTAAWYNEIEKKTAAQLGTASGQNIPGIHETIRIQNVSGAPLKKWQVVRYDFSDALVDYNSAIDHRHNYIIAQTATTGSRYAIMMAPTPENRLGEALVVGRSFVLLDDINHQTEEHVFVDLDSSQETYYSVSSNIRVVKEFDCDGVKLGFCTIANQNPIEVGIAKTTSALTAGTLGSLGSGTGRVGIVDPLFGGIAWGGTDSSLTNPGLSAVPTNIQVPYIVINGVKVVIPPGTSAGTDSLYVVFDLTANLSPGGTAAATVIATNSTTVAVGDAITVTDLIGKYRTYSGARGLGIWTGTTWVVVVIDQHPLLWTAILTSNTHDFTASFGGGSRSLGDVSNQQTITYNTRRSLSGFPFTKFPAANGTLNNTFNCLGKIGDHLIVSYDNVTDQHDIIDIIPATARHFQFKFTADRANAEIAGTETITFNGYQAILNSRGQIPSSGTARDHYGIAFTSKQDMRGVAVWNYKDEVWDILQCQRQATVVTGTISAFSGTPANITLNLPVGMDGISPTTGTLTVQNKFNWASGSSTKPICVMRDPKNGVWFPLQMECPS